MNTTTLTVDPITLARQVYASEPCARSFDQDLYLHLNTPQCIVIKNEHTLAFIRPVNHRDPYRAITNPAFISSSPDAWWVYLLAGRMEPLDLVLDDRYLLIGWERSNVPRFYNLKTVKAWITKLSPYLKSAQTDG